MAEPADFLIVALSSRALAAAARRAGRRARALDLFGDSDTRTNAVASDVVAGDLGRGFDEDALIEAAERLAPAARPPHGLVYGAGFEDRPALLERLSRGRRLCGNTPQTVARTKDPREFFALLDSLRIPHPELACSAPRDPEGWIVKRVGGSGGAHIAPATTTPSQPDEHYWQRRVAGRAIGLSFLADGERARPLGFSEQWVSPTAASPFRFGGMVQPAALDRGIAARLHATLDRIVRPLGLVGLNSLDALVDDAGRFHVIEVNPRPGANLDVFDGAATPGLFALHVQACEGALPASWQPPALAGAMAVAYADSATRVPDAIAWPDWVADRPAPGSTVEAGSPLCTVLTTHATAGGARRLVARRVAALRSLLRSGSGERDGHADNFLRHTRPASTDTNPDDELIVRETRSGTAA